MFCYLLDKLSTTLLCFFYALDNHFTFHALYTLSFVWITFHVTAWLLSFIAILYLPCLCYHTMIPALCAFIYCLIKIVWQHVTSKIIVCYHLPTRDEQELSLGMLIRRKRIYNFWCSMLVLLLFLHVLCALLYTFQHFSGTNLLTSAAVPVPVFCCFCISEKLYSKYSRNCTGQNPSVLFFRDEAGARRGARGSKPGGQTWPRRGQPWAGAWPLSGPTRAPPTPPLRPYILRIGKTLDTREEIHEEFRSRRQRRTHLGRVLKLFPAPCRREKSSPEASTSPCLPPRWCVSSPPRDYGSIAVARW